jgi:ribose transport system ATP-binding protein
MHAAGGTSELPVALAVHHLSKTFPGTRALVDVSLTVGAGHVHALIGNNGSGKSTLVKILAGVQHGDRGHGGRDGQIAVGASEVAADATSAAWARRVGLRFVHQDSGIFPGLTVAENLALGGRFPRRRWGAVDSRALHAHAVAVVERFGIAARPDDDVRSLPPAERVLLALGRALQDDDETRVLVLDEPTALLPTARAATVWVGIRRVVALGHAVLLVSHRLDEVVSHADAVTVLRDGRDVAHLIRPDLTEARLAGAMTGSTGEAPNRPPAMAPAPRRFAAEPALVVEDLRGGKVQAATFTVGHGEILGITGPIGGGQSDLLELLFGARTVVDGRIFLLGHAARFRDIGDATRAGVAYVPADRGAAVFPKLPLF